MKFKYRAKKGIESIEGTLEAENQAQAIGKLEAMGYLPIRVSADSAPSVGSPAVLTKKITKQDINELTRQLSSLIRSKVQLLPALEIIHRETRPAGMKTLLNQVIQDVREGQPLSQSLAKHPRYFSRIYINMVTLGEKGGMLENIFTRLVEFSERQEEIELKVRAALVYPIFMAVVGILTIFVMITFVMPRLVKVFSDMGQTLPVPTQILIAVSSFMQAYWYWVILGFGLMLYGLRTLFSSARYRKHLDKWAVALPVIGTLIKERALERFCRTLGLLIANGLPIRESIKATVPTLDNLALESELENVVSDLSMGSSVAQSLAKAPLFSGFMVSVISVGEESGRLDATLNEIAENYAKRLDAQVKMMSALIEPALILSIGLVVGFIVISMLLPIFEIGLK